MYELSFMTRVLSLMGCKLLVATSASGLFSFFHLEILMIWKGGAMKGMYNGCLMIVKDHINFHMRSPLAGEFQKGPKSWTHPNIFADTCDLLVNRYPDFSHLYSTRVAEIAHKVAAKMDVKLFEGVYGATPGPTYETHQEVTSFAKLGRWPCVCWNSNVFSKRCWLLWDEHDSWDHDCCSHWNGIVCHYIDYKLGCRLNRRNTHAYSCRIKWTSVS